MTSPTRRALDWVAAVLGPGWRAVQVDPLAARSSWVWRVRAARRDQVRDVVLRCHHDTGWLSRRPDLVAGEARVLKTLEGSGLPVPSLVGVDPDGSACGMPAVLSTCLPGTPMPAPSDDKRLAALAEALAAVHTLARPYAGIREYQPWYDISGLRPPRWSRSPRAWEKALEVVAAGPPGGTPVLLHRDFNHSNVLWSGVQVAGIVDWLDASIGPAGADLGHCRRNLAQAVGQAAADEFLRRYGGDLHPYWDLVSATDHLHDFADPPDEALDGFVADAVARLG